MTEFLNVITSLGTVAFWLGIAFGLVELTGTLAFHRWAFRLGRRKDQSQAHMEQPPTPGRGGTTRFAAFKVLADGTCLFRRKTGFLQTALEWKGMLEWRGQQAEVTAIQPAGPTLAGLGLVVSWSAYGVNAVGAGNHIVGMAIVVTVVVITASSLKAVARTGRVRFAIYAEEVTKALAQHGLVA